MMQTEQDKQEKGQKHRITQTIEHNTQTILSFSLLRQGGNRYCGCVCKAHTRSAEHRRHGQSTH